MNYIFNNWSPLLDGARVALELFFITLLLSHD